MERFNQQVNAIRGDAGMRRKVLDVVQSSIQIMAKKGLIDEHDVKESFQQAQEALIQDTESLTEENLLQVAQDTVLMHWQHRGLYSDELAAAFAQQSNEYILGRLRSSQP